MFLFPTTFRNEAQSLVVLEAVAAGVFVIAYGSAFIPSLLKGGAALIVPCEIDFRCAAVEHI